MEYRSLQPPWMSAAGWLDRVHELCEVGLQFMEYFVN